jgi:hypothetical protein
MFIKPHPFIKKVEQKENISLSVFRLVNVKMIEIDKDKFTIVYLNSSYPTQQYNEVIYKTMGGFYLLYKSTGTLGYYSLEIFFPADKLNSVLIFLKSISKKNDTTNITGSSTEDRK